MIVVQAGQVVAGIVMIGGSSSSWSSSSWDDDDGWSSRDSNHYEGESSLGGFIGFSTIIVVIIVVLTIQSHKTGKKSQEFYDNYVRRSQHLEKREPEIYQGLVEEKVKQVDELFNEEEFNQKAKMLFIKMQNAWTDRKWEEIRPFETDELFEQHKMQIEGYIRSNTINVMDRICVLYSKLLSFEQTGDKDVLNVVIKSRMSDYIIDATTKELIKGDKETERIKFYRLEFIRKTGVKTKPEETGINDTNCPNCGAPTKITSSGQCEYCKSIITNGEFGWVLNNLEPYNF